MTFSCAAPARRFGIIGAAFLGIGFAQADFLPIGLALLVIAAVHQWRANRVD